MSAASTPLNLKIMHDPPNMMNLTIEDSATGMHLKQRLQYIVKKLPDEQVLSTGDGTILEDMKTLKAQGVTDGETIVWGDEESPPAAVIARQDSALRENIRKKGDNSYYYAHKSQYVVPADAKVVTGPGLITGGPPELLEVSASLPPEDKAKAKVMVTEYSWADDGDKVKVYVEGAEFVQAAEIAVRSDFEPYEFRVEAESDARIFVLNVESLSHEIIAESSKHRVSKGKRVTITLKKKNGATKWYDLKKHKS